MQMTQNWSLFSCLRSVPRVVVTIHDCPAPGPSLREGFFKYEPTPSSAELIAMATGRRGAAAYADEILTGGKTGAEETGRCRDRRSCEISRGMTPNAVQRLMAGVEIGLRIAELKSEYESTPKITSPATAMQYCRQQFNRLARESKQEEFWIVTLNTKNQPIDCHQITVGTLRRVLSIPVKCSGRPSGDADRILVLHNHPSGDPTPSDQDISVTERLEQTAEVIGIPVIDHIIVAGDKAVSVQEWRSGNRW